MFLVLKNTKVVPIEKRKITIMYRIRGKASSFQSNIATGKCINDHPTLRTNVAVNSLLTTDSNRLRRYPLKANSSVIAVINDKPMAPQKVTSPIFAPKLKLPYFKKLTSRANRLKTNPNPITK
jgi:hypothetical protein